MVSLLSLKEVTTLPDPLSIEAEEVVDPGNELRVIHFANGHGERVFPFYCVVVALDFGLRAVIERSCAQSQVKL